MNFFLSTERLGFRHWTEADALLAAALWTDTEVMRHLGGARTVEDSLARLRIEMENQRKFGFQYWPVFLKASGEHVGCAGLKPWQDGTSVLEMGVHIGRRFWRGRYGEEAARAVIEQGFATGATALMAGHGPQNTASEALIRRLGFVFSHREAWGPLQTVSPFYRMERPDAPIAAEPGSRKAEA